MKKIILFIFTLLLFYSPGFCQLLSWSPDFIQESSSPVVITVDATKGNEGLLNYTPTSDVYVHIGVITNMSTSSSDWRYVSSVWATTNPTYQATSLGNNKWSYTITGGLRNYFGISNPSETIQKIAVLFRSGNGNFKEANADGSDMYVPVYDNGLYARIDNPYRQPKYVPVPETITKSVGDNLPIVAKASQAGSAIQIYFNGNSISSITGTKDSTNTIISTSGNQTIIAKVTNGANTNSDTLTFFVNPPNNVQAIPSGDVEGINYEPGDTSATLVIYAPHKTSMLLLGDFNNWTASPKYLMNITPDGNYFWLRLTGLTPGVQYAYQYLIDNNLQVADYNSQLVLDKSADPFIPSGNFPGLKSFPTQASGNIASILQTGQTSYTWNDNSFVKPDKKNLIIYELLVRDFVATQSWNTLADTLNYLKKLGINAIEVMPFNNFEGASSWGYNSNFFFAPDKVYGTPDALRHFVDVCHQNGIAVIMDLAMDDVSGSSPLVQMYFNSATNTPTQQNPWLDSVPNIPSSIVVGWQFNHTSPANITLRNRVYASWINNYHIDGFRFDLAGGYTQTNYNTNGQDWQNTYDQGRVDTWNNIYSELQSIKPNTYCILESFVNYTEQKIYTDNGMMTWGNGGIENYSFNQATMGYNTGWDFSGGIYTSSGLTQPGLITYMESHDEERLMYKNVTYGNSAGTYNVKDTATALSRNGMAAAFWAMMPGPKMLYEFGELGYAYSINTCTDGTINNGCRTSPKPIHWDYLQNAKRLALHDIYSKLLNLKNKPAYLATFSTGSVNKDLSGAVKWMSVYSAALQVMVYGNFDVVQQTGTISFPSMGTWYNLFTGATINVSTTSLQSVTLQPGEYYVYVNQAEALPVTIFNFTGKNNGTTNLLSWTVGNEQNLKYYELQRSKDGQNFVPISQIKASGEKTYSFSDNIASDISRTYFYRIKSVDEDGNFSISSIIKINTSAQKEFIKATPNPFKDKLVLQIQSPMQDKATIIITDMSGRKLLKQVENLLSGNNKIEIDGMQNFEKGVYLLTVVESQQIQNIKVIKEN